jgi:hypothetical protein
LHTTWPYEPGQIPGPLGLTFPSGKWSGGLLEALLVISQVGEVGQEIKQYRNQPLYTRDVLCHLGLIGGPPDFLKNLLVF